MTWLWIILAFVAGCLCGIYGYLILAVHCWTRDTRIETHRSQCRCDSCVTANLVGRLTR